MGLTTDRDDPGLQKIGPDGKQETYLVLSDADLSKGFLLPIRTKYLHKTCGNSTFCALKLAETYARDPWFYGGTYCATCLGHFPLSEFTFLDGSEMSPELWTDKELARVIELKKEQGQNKDA